MPVAWPPAIARKIVRYLYGEPRFRKTCIRLISFVFQ